MEHEHKGLGCSLTLLDGLKQKHLEDFAREYRGLDLTSTSQDRGNTVRAAQKAGWILKPKDIDVDDSDPRVIRWMAEKINELYLEFTEIPPE